MTSFDLQTDDDVSVNEPDDPFPIVYEPKAPGVRSPVPIFNASNRLNLFVSTTGLAPGTLIRLSAMLST